MERTKYLTVLLLTAGLQAPLLAAVSIQSITPSIQSPQPLGTPITWTVTATNTGIGPLTFQFSVALGGGAFLMARDFNVGTQNAGVWTAQPFSWATIQAEGGYRIRVVAKDFATGQSSSQVADFRLTSRVTAGAPVANRTANPLVALFSAPACPVGSNMRVIFSRTGSGTAPYSSDWKACNGSASMNFYVAGMYPRKTYGMNYQIETGGNITNGPGGVSFTTGPLPTTITFPTFSVSVPPAPGTDTAQPINIHSLISFSGSQFLPVATDLVGNVVWYYEFPDVTDTSLLTRPLSTETLLSIQSGAAWQSVTNAQQFIRLIDYAGNIVEETNTGIIQNQLVALGFTDAGSCTVFAGSPSVGDSCLGAFHHEAARLPNGDYIVFADMEKIFQAGTQGDPSNLPVDVIGDIYIVLNSNFQVKWAWEAFQHAGGGTQLNINRPAVLGETCPGQGCPPIFLLGPNIAPLAHDWLHSNSAYYWPSNKDLVISIRHQDWVIKIDYQNGAGSNSILWRMGVDGDFVLNNIYQDSWPWFSHQHDFGIENNGAGPASVFDNGNTRVSAAPLGLGCTAGTTGCNSRGMVLNINEGSMVVTPVMSQDLGVFAGALGSAQLLSNGDYFFQPGLVTGTTSYNMELQPIPNTGNGTVLDSLKGPSSYRSFRQTDMYHPPTT